ncbi:MAG: sel1 repeat family protein [Gammaproteobacteria bacterium]|nr:MAG: sel1 repeat family protein [Gammaproteobacteria bacterium]
MNTNQKMELNSGIEAFSAKNFKLSMQLLQPFADNGEVEALYRLAIMYQNGLGHVPSEQKAFDNMYMAATKNFPLAQHGLGFMYLQGECITQDSQKAIKWLTKAANQGMTGSMATLSAIYEDGTGVDKNLALAKQWGDKMADNQ